MQCHLYYITASGRCFLWIGRQLWFTNTSKFPIPILFHYIRTTSFVDDLWRLDSDLWPSRHPPDLRTEGGFISAGHSSYPGEQTLANPRDQPNVFLRSKANRERGNEQHYRKLKGEKKKQLKCSFPLIQNTLDRQRQCNIGSSWYQKSQPGILTWDFTK